MPLLPVTASSPTFNYRVGFVAMASLLGSSNISNLIPVHPYYPLEVEIASYLANEWSVTVLLGTFSTVCAVIVLGTQLVVNKAHPHLPGCEKAAIWWFVLCKHTAITTFAVPILTCTLQQEPSTYSSKVQLLEIGSNWYNG